jgi:hypothetical protein
MLNTSPSYRISKCHPKKIMHLFLDERKLYSKMSIFVALIEKDINWKPADSS